MTITISFAAFLVAVLKLPGLCGVRHVAVFFALGAGQVHLAALAPIGTLRRRGQLLSPKRRANELRSASVGTAL